MYKDMNFNKLFALRTLSHNKLELVGLELRLGQLRVTILTPIISLT